MQGAGNDFVVVSGEEEDWSALAPALCDRRSGAGADGVLAALPSAAADVRMRMYNPDGTEDECGNGVRCLALYALRKGLVSSREFRMETLSGVKRIALEETPTGARVTAGLGAPRLEPRQVPVLVEGCDALGIRLPVDGEVLQAHALSTGTAHTVIFEIPDEERFQRLSPLIEHHPLFPERTSIMWTEITGPDQARVRIWERGAGETLACGTGAAAVAVAARLLGKTGPRVAVASRGGTLEIEIDEGLSLTQTGPAAVVYEGRWLRWLRARRGT